MRKFTLRIFMLLCLMASFNAIVQAQTFGTGSSYSQNFDTMRVLDVAQLPLGWKADALTTPVTVGAYATAGTSTQYAAGANMASNSSNGGIYNFGAGTSAIGNGDRAVGGMNTSNNPTSINIYLGLTTSTAITEFTVSYDIEKYRNGRNADGTAVQLYYSLDGTAGSWVKVPTGLTVYAPDANNDGYSPAPGESHHVDATFTLAVPNGSTLFFAWNISVAPGATGGNASNSPALGIDNVIVSAAAGGPGGLYFRSFLTTGNWNSGATWETSLNGTTYTYDPLNTNTPSASGAHTITVQSGHTVTVNTAETADELMVEGTLTITSPGTLSIWDGTGFDITVNGTVDGTGNLIMRSYQSGVSEIGTATLGTSTGTVTVLTTVERYISAASNESAWRLLTAPLSVNGTTSAVTSSVFANWQNNGAATPGIGTTVTAPTYTGAGTPGNPQPNATTGIDYLTLGYSLKWFDGTALVGVDNTKTTALFGPTSNNSFFIFINGDRSAYSPYSGGANTINPTTLTPTGGLQLGNKSFATSAAGNGLALIGNPYASHVDLDLFRLDNAASNLKTTYYYWDPYLTGLWGVGGYVTVSYDALGNETILPAGAYHTRYLQSGQAMFVQTKITPTGAASVTFNENQKAPTTVNNIFRTQTKQIDGIAVNLNVLTSGSAILLDGVAAKFDNSYTAGVDDYDAYKFNNVGESISLMRNGISLSLERRPLLTSDDILTLNLINLKVNITYQLEINPSLNGAGLNAFLVDTYLKTTTPIDLNRITTVDFTINSDAASTGANRFYISFAKPAVVTSTGRDGISIFPNPVTNGTINLHMNNMPAGVYSVRVINGMGQVVVNRKINHAAGNSTETIHLGKGSVKGIYQLEVVTPANAKFSSKVIAN